MIVAVRTFRPPRTLYLMRRRDIAALFAWGAAVGLAVGLVIGLTWQGWAA